jgi:hypothetical protein
MDLRQEVDSILLAGRAERWVICRANARRVSSASTVLASYVFLLQVLCESYSCPSFLVQGHTREDCTYTLEDGIMEVLALLSAHRK